ncbi:unnamed protein product [Mytilus coruscus]|uniref:Reverse transcriptase domain-containing protein n=1 Tax=Mytilus coruscus TaxID=42192 RepID=A0A6J8BAW2_MYTCO|nr:unnamed protein product [Mytilus coruscus]
MNDATKPHGKQSAHNDRRRGPFLPDGREICRSFNNNSCYRQDCRMMHHCAICLQWTFNGNDSPTYMYDAKLPFGHARSPKIFQQLSASVCEIMKCTYNNTCIAYLDDFLVIEDTFHKCQTGIRLLIDTLRRLGFNISWNKIEGPSQSLTFLGIVINTCSLSLAMPDKKRREFHDVILSFQNRKRASVKQLQSLCGKLNWACQMVKGGRTFVKRLIDNLSNVNTTNRNAKILLSTDFFSIAWWVNFMNVFNGTVTFLDSKPVICLQTDACLHGGAGYYEDGETMETQMLENSVVRLKSKGWASSTSGTYRTHLKTYLEFCENYDIKPVPCTTKTVELYIAFLVDVKNFAFSSIRSYLNIISVLHKSHDKPDPIASCWNVRHLLTGFKRELGTSQNCKPPVTPELLLRFKSILNLECHNNIVFWAACLTGFYGFLRPNNCLVKGSFDPEINLRKVDVLPCSWGMLVTLKVTKTLQFRSKPIEYGNGQRFVGKSCKVLYDISPTSIICDVTSGDQWSLDSFRKLMNGTKKSYLGEGQFTLEIECHDGGNISIRQPIKLQGMTSLTVRNCYITDYYDYDFSQEVLSIESVLQNLKFTNCKIEHSHSVHVKHIQQNSKKLLAFEKCQISNTLRTFIFQNSSLDYHPERRPTSKELELEKDYGKEL